METDSIREEFEAYGTWITKFRFNGKAYGGTYDAEGDVRLVQFSRCFPNAKTILELGGFEGGHTMALAMRPGTTHVTSIEGRLSSLRKAKFIRDLYGVKNVTLLNENLEEFDLESLGTFDVVYNVGVLYHLPEPWKLLRSIANVSNNLFLWTHYTQDSRGEDRVGTYKGRIQKEGGLDEPLSGLSPTSFWPTRDELKRMLRDNGFQEMQIIDDNPNHPNGPCVTLSAVRQRI